MFTGLSRILGVILFMCFCSPIRNDPKKTHKQNFATHPVLGQSRKFVYAYVFFHSLNFSGFFKDSGAEGRRDSPVSAGRVPKRNGGATWFFPSWHTFWHEIIRNEFPENSFSQFLSELEPSNSLGKNFLFQNITREIRNVWKYLFQNYFCK